MKKKDRHALLQQIVQEKTIQRQEDFVHELKDRGYDVTQATISRDMKELQLIKIPEPTGGYRYSLPPEVAFDHSRKIEKLMQDSFVSINSQNEFVLIKTVPGNAFALGSLIENAEYKEVFGSIAGDDTVLVICKDAETAETFRRRIISLI